MSASVPPERPSPEEILARQTYDIPRIRVPDPAAVFGARARRLRTLAPGHAISDYLLFIARLADAQQASSDALLMPGHQTPAIHETLTEPPPNPTAPMPSRMLGGPLHAVLSLTPPLPELRQPLPGPEQRALSQQHGMPAVDVYQVVDGPLWRAVLRELAATLLPGTSGPLADVLEALIDAPDAALDLQAHALLAGGGPDLEPATAPMIGAALQVVFTDLAARLGSDGIPPLAELTVCPCCGSRPTASVARIGAAEAGFRYLHCSLCAVEWHRVRIQCTQCASGKDIHYQSVDDGRPGNQHAVKAECCDACGSYLKIMYLERDPELDPVADDLATLALDLLVDAAGKLRSGVNFMLVPGEAAD